MSGFPPGPWKYVRQSCTHSVQEASGLVVAEMDSGPSEEAERSCAADAQLIAAAPDLYSACEAALEAIEPEGGYLPNEHPSDLVVQLRAALSKAKGEA
jgi:hypothetical protein